VTARCRSLAEGFGIGKEKWRRHRPLPRPPDDTCSRTQFTSQLPSVILHKVKG
jgi:hypothetical protein